MVSSAAPGVLAARARTPVTRPSAVPSPVTSVASMTVTLGSFATRPLISHSRTGLLSAMPSRPDGAGRGR
jgi:hypothetical protein